MFKFYCLLFIFFLPISALVYGQEKTGVAVHTDPRLAVLVKKNHVINKHNQKNKPKVTTLKKGKKITASKTTENEIYNGNGFRVQIYNGTDRYKALKVREEFDKNYPGIHSYLTFVAPHYRVKVGNYRNKRAAMGMFKEASSSYYPCMIVPDKVIIDIK